MNIRISLIAILLLLSLFWSVKPIQAAPPGPASDWMLMFNDEFEGTTLNTSVWSTKYPSEYDGGTPAGRTNNDELEWYVDTDAGTSHPYTAHAVSDGVLKLTARYQCIDSGWLEYVPPYTCSRYPYTSGMISGEKFLQQYGYFETRMRYNWLNPDNSVPVGLWPAFWMLVGPTGNPPAYGWPPEIDVMEYTTRLPNELMFTLHYTDENGNWAGSYGEKPPIDRFTFLPQWHTFGVQWEQGLIVWYMDGNEVLRTLQNVPAQLMYVLLNLAVGGSTGGTPNPINAVNNKDLEIDYVRIYQKNSLVSPGPSPSTQPISTPTPIPTPTPGPAIFWDDLDPVKESWTHSAAIGADDWSVVTFANTHSPTHAYFTSDVVTVKDDYLVTRPISLTANSQLSFWHTYGFEIAADGGVIEISTNGGLSFSDLGTHITSGNYTGIINNDSPVPNNNPIHGRSAWTGGTLGTMTPVTVNLNSFAGQSAIIRFRNTSDLGTGGSGWYIDDIRVTGITTASPSPSSSPCNQVGDINHDCSVNLTDLRLVISNWLSVTGCQSFVCDVNGDGKVGAMDAVMVISKIL